MKTWAKDEKHLSGPGSHSRRQGRLENGWREHYPFPSVQCSGEHCGIGRSGVMAGTITLMWISVSLRAPGSLTEYPEGRWKVLADAKKERVSVSYTGVPITPGWKLKETENNISTGTALWSLNVKKTDVEDRRQKYMGTLMGGAPAVSLKNKGGSLKINAFISGREWKTQEGWRWGRLETDCVCWLRVAPTEQDEKTPWLRRKLQTAHCRLGGYSVTDCHNFLSVLMPFKTGSIFLRFLT